MLAADRITELTGTIDRLAKVAPKVKALHQAFVTAGFGDDRAHTYTLALIANVMAVPSPAELPQPVGE